VLTLVCNSPEQKWLYLKRYMRDKDNFIKEEITESILGFETLTELHINAIKSLI